MVAFLTLLVRLYFWMILMHYSYSLSIFKNESCIIDVFSYDYIFKPVRPLFVTEIFGIPSYDPLEYISAVCKATILAVRT
jgi:hypothetical protein